MSEGRKAGLFLIFVTVFIDLLGFGIVLPLLPRYGEHFEAGGGTLGLLMASFSAMQFIFAPIWGRISDRVGRRPILILGLLGSTVFYGMFGFATSLGKEGMFLGIGALSWLFITRIGAGIAGATIPTAQAYIADITGPKERGKGMALIGAAFGIGFTFGPLIGAAFVSAETGATPSAAPGYVACVLSGMAALLSIFKLPESLNKQTSESLAKRHHWFDVASFRHALSRPCIGLILLTSFLTTFAFAQFESTLSLLTQELGFAARSNFFIFAYIGFILTLSQGILVRRLIPKVGEYRMGLAGIILMVLGLLLIGVAGNSGSYMLLYAVLPISVIGFSATTPSLQSLLSLNTSEDQQGGVLGVGQSISALARILGPLAGIILFKGTQNGAIEGSITSPYWVGAAIMLLGLILMSGLKTSTDKNEDS
ncbi:Tetracycline resistance protein, class C [Gimesia alba]|uniref:Tetracycline resistance protein, class C n=1 Tax=Gimesia alba TaxID=2527973 RepID=A0A517RGQ1_9PLAN|nr:MFS transporter [Gimesia alba]QDT43040.1 Tetracycline resistance protein, class C [Gimesia alba]